MSKAMDDAIRKVYRQAIEFHFKDHPHHDFIMEAYDEGSAPPEAWDLWYAEADLLAWKRLAEAKNKRILAHAEGDNMFFRFYEKGSDGS